MKVSPGCKSARNTAWFIWLPELGCTLAKFATEQFLGAFDGDRFDLVDIFATTIIALARIALGIFVGQHRTCRLKHRARGDVFGRDQFDLFLLAFEFL